MSSPDVYEELEQLIGKEKTEILEKHFSGQFVYFGKRLNKTHHEIARLIGYESLIKLIEYFGGNYIYFKTKRYEKANERNKKIIKEFNGENYRELAKKYNLSEVWIREIVKNKKEV